MFRTENEWEVQCLRNVEFLQCIVLMNSRENEEKQKMGKEGEGRGVKKEGERDRTPFRLHWPLLT